MLWLFTNIIIDKTLENDKTALQNVNYCIHFFFFLPVLVIRRRIKDASISTSIVANINTADVVFLKQEVEYLCNDTQVVSS